MARDKYLKVRSVVPSAARTTSSQTPGATTPENFDDVIIQVICTAASGGGTVTVSYQVSLDEGTTWTTVDSVAAVNAPGSAIKRINAPLGQLYRLDLAIAGTTITFEVALLFSKRS